MAFGTTTMKHESLGHGHSRLLVNATVVLAGATVQSKLIPVPPGYFMGRMSALTASPTTGRAVNLIALQAATSENIADKVSSAGGSAVLVALPEEAQVAGIGGGFPIPPLTLLISSDGADTATWEIELELLGYALVGIARTETV